MHSYMNHFSAKNNRQLGRVKHTPGSFNNFTIVLLTNSILLWSIRHSTYMRNAYLSKERLKGITHVFTPLISLSFRTRLPVLWMTCCTTILKHLKANLLAFFLKDHYERKCLVFGLWFCLWEKEKVQGVVYHKHSYDILLELLLDQLTEFHSPTF